ncbi:hypothetical protein G6O69_36285 [Pseudenhygromyxa sp. WMMC2535]|uniref:hypothetical protein n=1 Tax=Pseudenhygromyxa sp. WMMC2535 TaxID=2712867 RepID=UPI0015950EB3|nr:hypothetical protein [Pseudenhygromyxa sp. WMMC2535]NVB43341.1 hypothetical protein [Pseudenhygromyxa sp. WMMC2535]
MDLIDNTQESLSNFTKAASVLREVIPQRLAYVGVGVFGLGLGLGALVGVLGHRALVRRNGGSVSSANYEAWTKSKLYDLATERDIVGRGDMTKDELIVALREAA